MGTQVTEMIMRSMGLSLIASIVSEKEKARLWTKPEEMTSDCRNLRIGKEVSWRGCESREVTGW